MPSLALVDAGSLWIVFSLSFVTSLSGALMPGPLFTYTIARTLGADRRGWITGPRVIAGHAVIEVVLLSAIVLGVTEFIRGPAAAKVIGILGGALLVYMGIGLIRTTFRAKDLDLSAAPRGAGVMSRLGPSAAGAVVSMANPYWWVWWVTIGSAFLVRFDITFGRWPLLAAFYVGHELGDLGWYTAVSTAVALGRRTFPRAIVTWLLAACGAGMIGFGIWLGVSPFLGR